MHLDKVMFIPFERLSLRNIVWMTLIPTAHSPIALRRIAEGTWVAYCERILRDTLEALEGEYPAEHQKIERLRSRVYAATSL